MKSGLSFTFMKIVNCNIIIFFKIQKPVWILLNTQISQQLVFVSAAMSRERTVDSPNSIKYLDY